LSFKNGGEPLIRKNILSSVKMLGEILGISDIPLSTNAFMPKIIINAVNNKCHHKKIIVAENTQNNAVFPRLIIEFKRSLFLQNPNQFEY
jgi:molybdenum cofactor biosynthesis enzyme MoaA